MTLAVLNTVKQHLTGAAFILLFIGLFGAVCYEGNCASYSFNKYYTYYPGRTGAYYDLACAIAVLGMFSLIFVGLIYANLYLKIFNSMLIIVFSAIGGAFYFGVFVCECCAIDWVGVNSIRSIQKAYSSEKILKYYNDYKSGKTAKINQAISYALNIVHTPPYFTVYKKNPKYSEDPSSSEFVYLGSVPVCVWEATDIKGEKDPICVGSWSKNKLISYSKAVKKSKENEAKQNAKDAEKPPDQWKTLGKQVTNSLEKSTRSLNMQPLPDFSKFAAHKAIISILFSLQFIGFLCAAGVYVMNLFIPDLDAPVVDKP